LVAVVEAAGQMLEIHFYSWMGVVEEELVGVQLYLAALEFLGKEITVVQV
jgi:hypothetical protein